MTDDRRYSDRQMAMILRLATELETRRLPGVGRRPTGRTLAEIEDIAADAGISTDAIRAAAVALETEEPGLMARFLDAPTSFRFERNVPRALTQDELRELLGAFRWSFGRQGGEEVALGDGVGWRHKTDEGPLTQLEITPRDDHTRIRLLGRYEDPASWIVVAGAAATAVASGIGIEIANPPLLGAIGIIGGFAAASWLGARAWWRRTSAKVHRKLLATIDGLEGEVRRVGATTALPAERPPADHT